MPYDELKRDYYFIFQQAWNRGNLNVKNVPFNHLVEKRFRMGSLLLFRPMLNIPCRYLNLNTKKKCLTCWSNYLGKIDQFI